MIKWAPILPLIGGFPLGAHKTIGHPAEYVLSWEAFNFNDQVFMDYYEKKYGTKRYVLDDQIPDSVYPVDIVVATPPCAGLSMLNSSAKDANMRGGCAIQNQWIYKSLDVAFNPQINAKVVIVENAPALYTNYGKEVMDNIVQKAQKAGRSVTTVKTSTLLHGIPQERTRSFTFFWKDSNCPELEFIKRDHKTATEYLKEVDSNMINYDDTFDLSKNILNSFLFEYIIKKVGPNFRQVLIEEKCKTVLEYIVKHNLYHDVIKEAKSEKIANKILHIKHKKDVGKNFWDASLNIMWDHIFALVGKNMQSYLHPTENRLLNVRECLHFMGFPNDFYLDPAKVSILPKNVPVDTAADWVGQAVKFCNGELKITGKKFIKHNNIKRVIE